MKRVMLDLETLGTSPGNVIFAIGAVVFDELGLGEEFYSVINIESAILAGLVTDQDTLNWWSTRSELARATLIQAENGGDLILDVLEHFTVWLNVQAPVKEIELWGNGSDFDNTLLKAAYTAVGLPYPTEFWNNRCYRTLKNQLSVGKLVRQGVYHNALDDAKTQAVHCGALLRRLDEMRRCYESFMAEHKPIDQEVIGTTQVGEIPFSTSWEFPVG